MNPNELLELAARLEAPINNDTPRACERAAALLRQMAERGRAAPEGWQMVPKEPERAMWEAGAAHIIRLESDDDRDEQDDRYTAIGCAVAIYKDMLAAAPVPAEPAIPAGHWLAPMEPTEAMLLRARDFDIGSDNARRLYRAWRDAYTPPAEQPKETK